MSSPLDALPDPVVHIDADRRIVDANKAAGRLVGRKREELLGASMVDAFAPRGSDGEALLADGWHSSARLRSVTVLPEHDVIIVGPEGDRTVRVTGRYQRNGDGSVTGVVLALRPLPRRPADDPTGEVVSTLSHELRSPLTSLKGYTSLLLNRWDRLQDNQKRLMIEQVHHDADRVTRLMTELLDISRLEAGRLVLRRRRVDIAQLANDVVARLTLTCAELDCSVTMPADFPQVFADPDKVEQVLTNLVENAAKYASAKGMKVRGERLDGAVAVTVSDTGEGIPRGDLSRVFDKFFRREMSKPTGTGLGLWISRRLIEAHGGCLSVDSEAGKGTVFRFTLPVVDTDESPAN